jgi:hypothetical protein|tara:strand:+ start:150 stop:461 length:312 start_codon:yes stop_codon:yes gene_type:complete
MGNWDDDSGDETNGLSEIEQMQLDAVLLQTAYSNAWKVLSGQTTFENMMQNQFDNGVELILPYDPQHGPREEELENMIAYYIETEEYEKCGVLNKMLKEKYGN